MATLSVRLDKGLINRAAAIGKVLSRTSPKQIEHWAKIGKVMEENPELSYEFVKNAMISKAEKDAGMLVDYSFNED